MQLYDKMKYFGTVKSSDSHCYVIDVSSLTTKSCSSNEQERKLKKKEKESNAL